MHLQSNTELVGTSSYNECGGSTSEGGTDVSWATAGGGRGLDFYEVQENLQLP